MPIVEPDCASPAGSGLPLASVAELTQLKPLTKGVNVVVIVSNLPGDVVGSIGPDLSDDDPVLRQHVFGFPAEQRGFRGAFTILDHRHAIFQVVEIRLIIAEFNAID